ncbi:D-glycero-beta-D-manno-heptose 1-phosphate adenylyltransferase [Streptomyces sp. NPDC059740]|uniref:D-glycero-beta-D-manno-heptose 1-phosphate adenylyltransferase n=1 Tax=Streptomyces sp. NPDC059740 TaxID=3346926 RepID=UPI00365F09C4
MSNPAPLLVVGDALLDHDIDGRTERLAPDAPVPVVHGAHRASRPGGAALAAHLAAADGREVTLVTALGDDEASHALRSLLRGRVHLVELPLRGALSQKSRVMAAGHPLLRIDDGEGHAAGATDEARNAIRDARAILVADYGRGTAEVLRPALARAAGRVPLVWDPHPRGAAPVRGARLVTPSAAEARHFAAALPDNATPPREPVRLTADAPDENAPRQADGAGPGEALRTAARDARALVKAWHVTSVAVTLADRGALLSHGEAPLLLPAPWQAGGDPCGAGDRFAATAAGQLADGALPEDTVQAAVHAATHYVALGGARALTAGLGREDGPAADLTATDLEPGASAAEVVARVKAAGGTVVAAGGCFDLVHAGHVSLLQAARRTGDCLVVCVNSDASVRRRKGEGRPIVPAADRVRVLRALECVDAVAVFDEDTPERLLGDLRPHIWVKGGDYALAELPEAALLESWGGQVVLLPYLDGRSSTSLVTRATAHRLADTGEDPERPGEALTARTGR